MTSPSTTIRRDRRGLTLIEIMIALTMTLIVLGAMMSAFQFASQQMQTGRSIMEMANRLRSAEELMRSDLANLTVDPRPYTETTLPPGYFALNESTDRDLSVPIDFVNSYQGDIDDSLGMTVRSKGRPYRGRQKLLDQTAYTIVESPLAEVFWYTSFVDLQAAAIPSIDFEDSLRVHRRVLLIRPDLTGPLVLNSLGDTQSTLANINDFIATNDISVRVIQVNATQYELWPNSLTDLAVRKNRFAHTPDGLTGNNFPNLLNLTTLLARTPADGTSLLLTDVASFDLKVYSPNSNVREFGTGILAEPSDPGFSDANGDGIVNATDAAIGTVSPIGAFVDLNHVGGGWFGAALPKSQLTNTYDTWTPFYESDGINQDVVDDGATPQIDEGTDGLDSVGGATSAPDDNAERETAPPYPFPIRGIKVTFRLVEKKTKQIHQASVTHSYVPE
ncbi:MAG: PilW family protein [Mariniblastus sp.]